jgi:hypothetical protein
MNPLNHKIQIPSNVSVQSIEQSSTCFTFCHIRGNSASRVNPAWIIENWRLDIIYLLLFGNWDLVPEGNRFS